MVGLVLACGGCTDALVESRIWWLGLMPFFVLGLFAEGAVFTVVTWLRRIETVSPRAKPAALAGGIFTLSLFSGVGVFLGLSVVAVILLLAAGWSLYRNYRFSPSLSWVRVALVLMGAAVGLWRAVPSHRSTERLVTVALTATRLRVTDGWVLDELRSRLDTLPELEQRAEESSGDETILKLHAALGGPELFRQQACSRWRTRPSMGASFDEMCPLPGAPR